MSFLDWVTRTRTEFRQRPPKDATVRAVLEFYSGFRGRVDWFVSSQRGWIRSELGDESVKFVCETVQDARRARSLFNEKPVLDWLLSDARPSDVFWDVGAYQGNYSVIAASKGCSVVAFEPNPENAAILQKNVEVNEYEQAVDVRNVALSSVSTGKRFDPDTSESAIDSDGDTTVRALRGDEVEPAPDLVKIDVEGHEVDVLDGMVDTLRQTDRVAIEVHNEADVPQVKSVLDLAGLYAVELDVNRPQTYIGGVKER